MTIDLSFIPDGKSGDWRVETFEIPDKPDFQMFRLGGRAPSPGKYKRLVLGNETVMSNTPAEINDHLQFIERATGSVLINGLGLGMCIVPLLQKPEVTDITVVEASADVILLIAPHYTSHPKVRVVHADAFGYEPEKGKRFGAVWHDIWTYICSDNLIGMKRLHRKYGRKADWQGSWARQECERQRRQDDAWSWALSLTEARKKGLV